MKYTLIKWVILWFLSIPVTSCLFSCCKRKEMIVFKPRISDDPIKLTPSESNETVLVKKKNIIQDDNTNLYLTNDQKEYVYALSPVLKLFCRLRSSPKNIICLIINYLGAPFPTFSRDFQMSAKNQWAKVGNCYDYNFEKFSVASCEFFRVMTDTSKSVCCFTSDGHYIIAACVKPKTLKMWTVPAGTLVQTFKGHNDDITSCSLSTNDQILLSTSRDQDVYIWAVRTGRIRRVFPAVTLIHYSRSYWPWGQFCNRDRLVVTASKHIKIWDVNTGECVRVLRPQRDDWISRCVFSDNEHLLLSLGNDGVSVWEFATGKHVQAFREHGRLARMAVKYACFVRQDTQVASIGGNRDSLCIWRVYDAQCIHRFADYERMICHSYWLKSATIECIIVSMDNQLHVLAVESGETIFAFTGGRHTCRILDFSVSSDGRYLASCSFNNASVFIFAEHKK